MAESPPYVERLAEHDPEFAEHVATMRERSRTDGALPAKTKLLIAVALDAATNFPDGVASLAGDAREAGASDAEIAEAVEVAIALRAVQGLVTGANAFEGGE